MTATSEAIIRTSNSDAVTESSTLDLGLDTVVLLKRQGKLSVKNITSASSVRGWLESSSSEGERWLRSSAQNDDLYAMEKLGLRLLTGDGLPKSIAEGLEWLKKSAELGNPFAMEKLAEYEFDQNETPGSRLEGERWLRSALEHGSRPAMAQLGGRLLTGNGLTADPEQGERFLRQAAGQDSQIAMTKLGAYLLSGWGLKCDRKEGLRWLRRAGATNSDQLLELGLHLYQQSLKATTIKAGLGLAQEAGIVFQEALDQGNRTAALNLAYLLRRGEIGETSYPSLDELLSDHLDKKDPFALVNQALRLAKGIQCDSDWKAADIQVGRVEASSDVLEWWFARSREGDPEGHLVTGWLGRHHLAADPDGFQVSQRMDLARKGGWLVPGWMNSSTTARQNS
jgi:TPR repeat protein